MPYEGEYAHYQPLKRIVESERVQQLLRRSRVLNQANLPQQAVPKTPPAADATLPPLVLAIDGSHAEVDVRNGYPGAKIGYCSVASVVLNLSEVDRLDASRPVSPIDFRRTEEPSSVATALPGCNVITRDQARPAVDANTSSAVSACGSSRKASSRSVSSKSWIASFRLPRHSSLVSP